MLYVVMRECFLSMSSSVGGSVKSALLKLDFRLDFSFIRLLKIQKRLYHTRSISPEGCVLCHNFHI